MSGRSDALVLFGGTGDLAQRKLYPALHELARMDRLPATIVSVAASDWSVGELRDRVREAVGCHGTGQPDATALDRLVGSLDHVAGDYREPDTFARLAAVLEDAEQPLLYLAIPPSLFEVVVAGLREVGLTERSRVVLEKPFGRDLASARALNECVLAAFPEEAVLRIDHFLGKDQVLDLLVFRLANSGGGTRWDDHRQGNLDRRPGRRRFRANPPAGRSLPSPRPSPEGNRRPRGCPDRRRPGRVRER